MTTTTTVVENLLGATLSDSVLNPEAGHFAPSQSQGSLVNYHDASDSGTHLCGHTAGSVGSGSTTRRTTVNGRENSRPRDESRTSPERYALEMTVVMADVPGSDPPPIHAWNKGVVKDMLRSCGVNPRSIVMVEPGRALLLFGQMSRGQGLTRTEALRVAYTLPANIHWVGRDARLAATACTVSHASELVATTRELARAVKKGRRASRDNSKHPTNTSPVSEQTEASGRTRTYSRRNKGTTAKVRALAKSSTPRCSKEQLRASREGQERRDGGRREPPPSPECFREREGGGGGSGDDDDPTDSDLSGDGSETESLITEDNYVLDRRNSASTDGPNKDNKGGAIFLPVFTGEEKDGSAAYETWRWDLITCRKHHSDKKLVPYVMKSLQGPAGRIARTTGDCEEQTLTDILRDLDRCFRNVTAYESLLKEATSLVQEKGETVTIFFSRLRDAMQALYERKPDKYTGQELSEMTHGLFYAGIHDSIRREVTFTKNGSLDDLFDEAREVERSQLLKEKALSAFRETTASASSTNRSASGTGIFPTRKLKGNGWKATMARATRALELNAARLQEEEGDQVEEEAEEDEDDEEIRELTVRIAKALGTIDRKSDGCYICGEKGHFMRECPSNVGTLNKTGGSAKKGVRTPPKTQSSNKAAEPKPQA